MATFEPKSALPDNVTDRGKVERIKLSGPGNSTEETEWIDVATQAELDAHTADTSAAHAASAISFSATGSIAGTDVQAAVAEVATDAAAALSSHEADTTSVHGIADTSALVTTSTALGGDLTGTVGNAQIAAGAVGATELASNAVTNDKVADDAIGIAELSATGTPSSSTFLRGDNSWATPSGGASALDDLTDVTITGASTGQVLKYNGSAWINDTDATAGGTTALDDLSDVAITAAVSGDILRHNGTSWVDTPGTDHYETAGAVSTHSSDTTSVHGIADTSALLDTADIGVSVQAYSAVLAATTASFTTADETKLDGIETAADVTDETNVVAAISGATLTDVGTPASTDKILLLDASDSDNLKYADFSEFGGGGGSGGVQSRPAQSTLYGLPGGVYGAYGAFTAAANTLVWFPFIVDKAITITNVTARCRTLATSSNVRIAIAPDSGNTPSGTLVWQSASLDTSSTGEKETSSLSLVLDPGVYWVGINSNSNPQFTAFSVMVPGSGGRESGLETMKMAAWETVTFGAFADPYTPGTLGSFVSNCPVFMKWTVN